MYYIRQLRIQHKIMKVRYLNQNQNFQIVLDNKTTRTNMQISCANQN